MILDELLEQSGGDDRKIRDISVIEFSRKVIKFGDSIYQLKNVTGFTIGALPRQKISWLLVVILIAVGVISLAVVIGIIPLGIAGWMIYSHYTQVQEYGLILELNSGKTTSFISSDRPFLGKLVLKLCSLMEGDVESFTVNWKGHVFENVKVKGVLSTGEGADIDLDYDEN